MSFDEFTNFVLYAPPGSATFHYRNQGWTVGDHLSAFQLDVLNHLWWAKTADGHKGINRPPPTLRPTTVVQPQPEDEDSGFVMTVEDYVRMVAEAQEQEQAEQEEG